MRVLGVVLLATASVACSAGPDASLFVSKDSAGIRIAESGPQLMPGAMQWTLSAEPVLRLSCGPGAEREFYRIRGGALLSSGGAALANSGTSEIRVFGSSGELIRLLGGSGAGPGEFLDLADLVAVPGDTLMALDSRTRRVSVFGPKGDLVREITLRWPGRGYPVQLLPLGDRIAAYSGWTSALAGRQPPEGTTRLPQPIHVFTLDGQLQGTPASPPGLEFFSPQPGQWMVPLFRRVSVVAARAGHLLVGHGNSFEFRVLTPEGTAVEIVRLRLPGRKLTTDDVRRATRQWVEYRNPPEVWSAAREGVAKLPTPTEAPPYLRLLVDDTGAAWVSEFAQFEEPRLWWVFDASGELVSRVDMPENFKVLAVDRDRVLGVRLDEFDVEHPEVYRLSR